MDLNSKTQDIFVQRLRRKRCTKISWVFWSRFSTNPSRRWSKRGSAVS